MSYFTIRPLADPLSKRTLVSSGVRTGIFGESLFFEITAADAPGPLTLRVETDRREGERPGLHAGKIDGNTLSIRMNPPSTQFPFGIHDYFTLLGLQTTSMWLEIRFSVLPLEETGAFTLFYEFAETSEAPKEKSQEDFK